MDAKKAVPKFEYREVISTVSTSPSASSTAMPQPTYQVIDNGNRLQRRIAYKTGIIKSLDLE